MAVLVDLILGIVSAIPAVVVFFYGDDLYDLASRHLAKRTDSEKISDVTDAHRKETEDTNDDSG